MGYLDIHNKGLSGNTCRIYLSDYGKSVLATCSGLADKISKFGLSDNDVDYRRFVGDGSCVGQDKGTGFTSTCFYDLPDSRGGEPITFSADYGTNASICVGPRFTFNNNRINFYETSLGVTPIKSTMWMNYTTQTEGEIPEPQSGLHNSCWVIGNNSSMYYPTCCYTCADFTNTGSLNLEDLKFFLTLMGSKESSIKNTLVGDFNGDGVVDRKDLEIMMNCLYHSGYKLNEMCNDKEIFCLMCDKLGENSFCNGDCFTCI